MKYDLIVLGGGPAGYLGAERAAQAGMQVLLVEQAALGGVCLNEGCIPTKTLLHSAKLYGYANGGAEKYGVRSGGAELDYPAVIARKDKVVKTLVGGVAATMKRLGVRVVNARGVIRERLPDGGYAVEAGDGLYQGGKLLVCTGSQPVLPPIPGLEAGLESGAVVTNREILSLQRVPEKLVVIGGGVIGLEISLAYRAFGAEVTVIEMLDQIGGRLDGEIAALLLKHCKKAGIRFALGAQVTAIEDGAVVFAKDGAEQREQAGLVLMSVGRRASTAGVGLENIGVLLERGAVVTDERMKTNQPGVYAAGDVNGRSMLAHTAYREAEVAVNNMTGVDDRMHYGAVPGVIYTQPEAATIGETLAEAVQRGADAREVKLPMAYSGRYLAENEGGDGIAKLVVETGSGRVLGFHMLGTPASEIVSTLAVAMEREIPVPALKKAIFPHPTAGEIVRELLFAIH